MSNEHLYKRGEIWWFRCTVNFKEYRESLRCSDVKVARKRRDARLAEIEGAVRFGEVTHTWEEAVTQWAEYAIGQISRTTAKRYAVSLKQVYPMLSGKSISTVSGKDIQTLVEHRRRNGATPATVRRDLTAISRVLEYAEALGWREGNPTLSKRKLLRERRDPISLPTTLDIEAMTQASSPRFSALITAALLTGCRQDELTSLTWKQFQPKTGTLEVIGKGNKRRTIQLSEAATAHLDGTVRVLGSDLIFCTPQGTKWIDPASYFVKIRDRVLMEATRIDAYRKGWRKKNWKKNMPLEEVERRVGKFEDLKKFKPFRFHDLRHLWAVEALRGGMGLYALSKHLGHTSVSVTERVYLAFLTPEEAEAAKAKAA
jgi:integrase/recombinase XerD